MEIDVRTVTDNEVAAWSAGLSNGFLDPADDVDVEARRPSLQLDRTWGAFDGDTVVATLRSFRSQMTVPGGGALEASAVTAVTTTCTHRRRGLASRLMAGELAASVERGEQMSVLIAAEWRIYGRFRVRRRPSWSESKPSFNVVARDPAGLVTGVARYRYKAKWEHRQPAGQVTVRQFLTGDPAAEALLWHHLRTLDLTASVRVEDRPADKLVPLLLTDARHARPSDRADFLWVRPLDVAGMLAARSYPVSGQVVLEVVDSAGLAGGRFALDGGPDGASCARTTASPDLTLDVATLGSAYLGGYAVRMLAAVGLIDEHSTGAVARADAMFRSPVTPWCSTWF